MDLALPRHVMVPAILGVLRAGAAHLPPDPDHPAHRLEYIDAAPFCLLTSLTQVLDQGAVPR
ncbi:hypothetical protein ACFYRN_03370 [Streptomyces sp. NPDC005227]|uniref:hypothetical protein n=1 Tax=Streptomyces sp. NPDC005227 TaxID=3364707 RepID=UPI0036AA1CF7